MIVIFGTIGPPQAEKFEDISEHVTNWIAESQDQFPIAGKKNNKSRWRG